MKLFCPPNFSPLQPAWLPRQQPLHFAGSDPDVYMRSASDTEDGSDGDSSFSTLPVRGKRTAPTDKTVKMAAASQQHLQKRPRLLDGKTDHFTPSSVASPIGGERLNPDFEVNALDENTIQMVCSSPLAGDVNGVQNIMLRHINAPSLSDRSRFPLRDWRYPVHVMDEFADDRNPTLCHPQVRERANEAVFTLSEDSKSIVREFYKPRRDAEKAIAELEKNNTQLLRRKIMGLPNEHIGYVTRLLTENDVSRTEHQKIGTWGLFAQVEPDASLPTVQNCRMFDFYDGALLLNEQQRAYHEKSYGSKYINYSLEVGTDELLPHVPVAAYGGGNEMQFANMAVVAHRDKQKPYGYRLEPHQRKTNADYLTGTITLPNKFGKIVSYPVGGLIGRSNLKPGQEICPPYGPDFMPSLEELYFGPQPVQDEEPFIQRERSPSPSLSVRTLQGIATGAMSLLKQGTSTGFTPSNGLPRPVMAAHVLLDRLDTAPDIRAALKTMVQWPEVEQKSLTNLLTLYEDRVPGASLPGRNSMAKLVGEYNRLRSGLMPHIGLLPGRKEIDIPDAHKAAFMRYYNAQPSGQTIKEFRQGFEAVSGIHLSRSVTQKLIASAPINKLSLAKIPPKVGDHHPDHGAFQTFVRNNRYYEHLLKGWVSIGQFYRWFMQANPDSTFTPRMADFAKRKHFTAAGLTAKHEAALSVSDGEDSLSELSEPPSDLEDFNPFACGSLAVTRKVTDSSALALEQKQFTQWAKENPSLDYPFLVWKKMHPETQISKNSGAKLLQSLKEPEPDKPMGKAELNAIRFVETITDSSNEFWKERLGRETLKTLKGLYNEQHPQHKVSLNTSTDLAVNKAVRQNNADPAKPHIGSGAIAGNKTDRALQGRVLEYILTQGQGKSLKALESALTSNGMRLSQNTFRNWIAQTPEGGWKLKTNQLKSEFPALAKRLPEKRS